SSCSGGGSVIFLRDFLLDLHGDGRRPNGGDERGHVLVTLYATEPLLRFSDAKGDPAANHALIAPSLDVARDAPQRPVHVLDRVGRGERSAHGPVGYQAHHGERLVESLAQAGGGAVLAIGVEPRGELQQLLLR